DLWSARGDLPADLNDVTSRQKEIQYSSRTRANTDHFKQMQCVRMALATLLQKIPIEILESDEGKLLRSAADRNVYQIVHLIYRSKNYEVQSKDYEFSRNSMIDHWNAGYNDAVRTLRHPEALQRPANDPGVATFDVVADGRERARRFSISTASQGAEHEGSRRQGTHVRHAVDKPSISARSLSFRQSRVHDHHLSNGPRQ